MVAAMGGQEDECEIPEPPSSSPPSTDDASGWLPKLGPIGLDVLRDTTPNILLHGERGSLKSGIALHKIVLALHENYNNLGVMYTLFRGSATEGGIWEKLLTYTLPEWRDGIGLEFTEPKMDDQKNRHLFIANQHNGWSRVVLKSAPPGTNLSGRMKGQEPGVALFDEISEADDSDYFHKLSQQLRRPHIPNPQFIMTCNPPELGDMHWLYDLFFTTPLTDPVAAKSFKQIHVPIDENVFWDKEQRDAYQQKLISEAVSKGDPTILDRMIHGKWTAKPLGNALLGNFYLPARHRIGDLKAGIGLRPVPGFPIVIAYDIGPAFTCVTFMQGIPTLDGKTVWIIFDEVDHFAERILYKKVALEVLDRMKFWRKTMSHNFQFIHITDESAKNQWRAGGEGSFDAWEFEKVFNAELKREGIRSSDSVAEVVLIGCPKGNGSREARVQAVRGMLFNGELFVSALADNTHSMFMLLPEDKNNPGCPLKRSKWSHKFDSLSYGLYFFKAKGTGMLFSYGAVGVSVSRVG